MKKFVAVAAVAASIAAGSVGLATLNPVAIAGAITNQVTGSGTNQQTAQGGQSQAAGKCGVRQRVVRQAVKFVADKLGMTPKDLVTELRTGKSINQIAQGKGVDPARLKDEIVQAIDKRIDQAVAKGTITQDRASAIESKVPDRVEKLMTRVWGQHQHG